MHNYWFRGLGALRSVGYTSRVQSTSNADNGSAWIRRYSAAPDSKIRLLCLPHAGGSASFFVSVARSLAPDIEVLAVQYPGRQDRRSEPCVESISELADRLLPVLLDSWTDRPLALFGHSMGSSVAFELAGLLEQESGTAAPAALLVSGRRAPSRLTDTDNVHQRSDAALIAEVKRLAGTDARLLGDEEIMRLALPALRADYRAAETYRPQRVHKVNCPVVALVGDEDPRVPIDEARAWRQHTSADFDLRVFPGGHFYLADRSADVIACIREKLLPLCSVPLDEAAKGNRHEDRGAQG